MFLMHIRIGDIINLLGDSEEVTDLDVEKIAVSVVMNSIAMTDILSPFINSGDKEPSWDGNIYIHSDHNKTKKDIKKIPVQVKGEIRKSVPPKKKPKFSVSVVDLNNWLNHGGIVLFVVLTDETGSNNAIYYDSLLPVKIRALEKISQGKKNISIPLKEFSTDSNKKVEVMLNFHENMLKQSSFTKANLQTMDEWVQKGGLENITFTVAAYGKQNEIKDFDAVLLRNDLYMYANVKDMPIPIPLPEIPMDIHIARDYFYNVQVKGHIFYKSYSIVKHKNGMDVHIGKGTVLRITENAKKAELSFRARGTLSECIHDTEFIISVMENLELTVNGATIRFANSGRNDAEQYRNNLEYYKDVQAMLNKFGVNKELLCDNLSDRDQNNLHNFTLAMVKETNIVFPGATNGIIYGRFVIANLVLLIWATKINEKEYKLDSFFGDHKLAVFEDENHSGGPHAITHYAMLRKQDFIEASNIDYEKIAEDLNQNEVCPVVVEQLTFFMLEMLKAYDEQEEKKQELLHAAEKYCDWLIDNEEGTNDNMILNKLQIVRRSRELSDSEMGILSELSNSNKELAVKCGANLLLGKNEEAQRCFDKMDQQDQDAFIQYPICNLGHLSYEE